MLGLIAALGLLGGREPEALVAQMSKEQLAAQLLVVPVQGGIDGLEIVDWLEAHPVGGLIFMGGLSEPQTELAAACQKAVQIPLLVAQDQEWGPAMRLPDGVQFPRALTLGALSDPAELEQVGRAMGELAHSVGVNWPLQPVADLLDDPLLSIIRTRSYGDQPDRVSACASALIQGLQRSGVLACAKHFPGHGAASADSHLELPTLPNDPDLCERALIPFQAAIEAGVETIMIGHLIAPTWDPTLPASLSPVLMQDLLRDQLGFEGLIVTDSFHMRAILTNWDLVEATVQSICAGADMVLTGDFRPQENAMLRDAVDQIVPALCKALTREQLEEHALRVLRAKAQIRPAKAAPDRAKLKAMIQRLYNLAVTLVGTNHLPCSDLLILAPQSGLPADRFGVSKEMEQQARAHSGTLIWLGTPWAIPLLPCSGSLLIGYENRPEALNAAVQVALGHLPARGQLPVSI